MAKFFDWKMILLLCATALLLLAMLALGTPSLDQRLYYTGFEARQFFAHLSAQDSANYRLNEMIDFAFIAVYTLTLAFSIHRLYPRKPLLLWIAFAPGIFDLIETGTILHILNFGETFPATDWLGVATFLKWASALVAIGMTLRGLLRRMISN